MQLRILLPVLFLSIRMFAAVAQPIVGPFFLYDHQYLTDKYIINPAFAGNRKHPKIFIETQRSAPQLPESPALHLAGIHTPIDTRKGHRDYRNGLPQPRNAIGTLIYADNNGPFQDIGLKLDYAYSVPINRKSSTLTFALGGMLFSRRINLSRYITTSITDPLISANAGTRILIPDVNAGVVYTFNHFYAGFSVSQLLENSYRFSRYNYTPARIYRNFYLLSGYRFAWEQFEIEPSFAAGRNFAPDTPANNGNFIDLNLEFYLRPIVYTVSWRLNGYITNSLLFRTDRIELGLRMDLFSTSPTDAYFTGLSILAAYTFSH